MNQYERYEAFMQKVLQRPLPISPMARIRTLARELAEGWSTNVWDPTRLMVNVGTEKNDETGKLETKFKPGDDYHDYFSRRWGDNYPNLFILKQIGFFDERYRLTDAAFELIKEAIPADVFISYSHQESSPFALLILRSLNEIGLYPFLDMAIPGGDDWNERIKGEIEKRDTFIIVLGSRTLESSYIRDEIAWAFGWGKTVIPIWHNGFTNRSDPSGLSPALFNQLNSKQAITVAEPPSAASYHEAVVKLLNRFGVTP